MQIKMSALLIQSAKQTEICQYSFKLCSNALQWKLIPVLQLCTQASISTGK